MQISGFIYTPFQMIWRPIAYIGGMPIRVIAGLWTAATNPLIQTDLWQHQGKPLYERHIQPLTKTDYIILSGSVILSIAGGTFALKKYGVAALPITMGASAATMMGAFCYSRYRLRNHFKEIAWKHVDNIRRAANDITYKNQNFGDLAKNRKLLEAPEFGDIKDDYFKLIDEEIRKFRQVALAPYYEDKLKIVTGHLNVLKALVQAHPQDKALIEALETEINKVGKPDQDLEKLETQMQSLYQLHTPGASDLHCNKLSQQIDDLIKAAQGPDLADSKKVFMTYLTGLMEKWAPYKDIADLTPRPPLNINVNSQSNDKPENPDDPEILLEEDTDGVQKNTTPPEVLLKEEKKEDENTGAKPANPANAEIQIEEKKS